MKKIMMILVTFALVAELSACGNPCKDGHTWKEATCTSPRTCTVCGEKEGEALGHVWTEASCAEPRMCTVCGATDDYVLEHKYNDTGECTVCGATKEYANSYGYFSKEELFAMAQDAIENYVYPSYIYNYCYLSDVHIEKVTDTKLMYGTDCYSVVATADIVINKISFEDISFVAVVEPHTKNTYASKDCYIAF